MCFNWQKLLSNVWLATVSQSPRTALKGVVQRRDDVMTWKRLLTHCWIKMPIMRLHFFVSLYNLLNTQSSCWWFKTPWHSCDVAVLDCHSPLEMGMNSNGSPDLRVHCILSKLRCRSMKPQFKLRPANQLVAANGPRAIFCFLVVSLQWRHNERDDVSNHKRIDCLLNRLFRSRSKKTSKFRVTGLCEGIHRWPVNSPHKGPVTRKMFLFDYVIILLPGVPQSVCRTLYTQNIVVNTM